MEIAIVTGASSGLGAHFARQLATEKDTLVLLVARRQERLNELAAEITAAGGHAEVLCADLTKTEDCECLAARIQNSGMPLRWLINNAGFGFIGPFKDQSLENISRMIALNIETLTRLSRQLLPFMKSGSHILNVASSAAFAPMPGFAVYAASKSYVLSFSRALRQELESSGISVTALCPGPVATEFFNVATADTGKPFTVQGQEVPKWIMEKPEQTARLGIKGAKKNRAIVTSSLLSRTFLLTAKLLPHSLIVNQAAIKTEDDGK